MRLNLLALAAGVASATGFAPWGLWPLTLAAFALLLWLIREAPRLRSALARGWWFGVGQFTLGLNWIATAFTYQAAMPAWLGWIAVVLLSLYLAVYPAAAAGLAWRWGRTNPLRMIILFAAAWIVTEWLRATMFTGFAWNPLGVALLPTPVAQLAAWLGTYGLSGITALIAGMLLLLALRHWREVSAVAGTVAVATGLALAISPAAPAPTATALRIVQPNISQADKWREGFDAEVLRRLVGLSAGGSTAGAGQRVLLWPEVAVTEPLQDARGDPIYQGNAAWTLSQVQGTLAPGELLLTGGLAINSRDGVRASGATNSVFGIERNRGILARYDKAHLVPYGEYLPMRPILSAIGLSRLAPGDLDTDPGPGPQTLTLPIVGKVGFQLCYEVIFSGEVIDRENRPNFLFNPSNDAWFGAWGPPQHLAQARLRALEEGMPVLRSTPTGISAVIDARGELLQSLPWRKPGVIDALLPAPLPPTLFARVGNLLPLVFALLLGAGAMLVGRQARAIAEEDEAR